MFRKRSATQETERAARMKFDVRHTRTPWLIVNSIDFPALLIIAMTTAERAILQLKIPFCARPRIFIPPITGRMIRPGSSSHLALHLRTLQMHRSDFPPRGRKQKQANENAARREKATPSFRLTFHRSATRMVRDENCQGDMCFPEPVFLHDRLRVNRSVAPEFRKVARDRAKRFQKDRIVVVAGLDACASRQTAVMGNSDLKFSRCVCSIRNSTSTLRVGCGILKRCS